ncbi:ArgP/LysG family DNA-binding transcriptional regulator [uncultured Corynebacterium sp.]|uniref:ArgP/LysG family DNA-binding transcriptional regulator n=1 Tax=uncultured Corynebacterium sp. TaxID=159447 RepID=UPI0025EC3BCB|nr:ArgP/LysG family DNA-binding transcriptional regulator [uncultured Corynebacterium sp.]
MAGKWALRHLNTLLAVVDTGSFDAAAASLGVSASAVSQRIKALESDIGRILVRRSSPASATPAGEILVQTARRMELLEKEAVLQLEGRLNSVPLSVVINADSLATWFRQVLADAATWPGAGLNISVEDERHSLRMLRRGDCMAVVTSESVATAGCEVDYLGRHRYLAVCSPGLARRFRSGDYTWETLPAARFGSKDLMEVAFLSQELGAFTPSPERREFHIPSYDGILDAVLAGLGWAMIPESTVWSLIEDGSLVQLHPACLDVPLYWQRWKVESVMLDRLTDSIHAAAASSLD